MGKLYGLWVRRVDGDLEQKGTAFVMQDDKTLCVELFAKPGAQLFLCPMEEEVEEDTGICDSESPDFVTVEPTRPIGSGFYSMRAIKQ